MPDEKWFGTTDAAKLLSVTPKYLREQRTALFKAARHYRLKNPRSFRPTYVWHVERCGEVLDKATKEAERIEKSQAAAIAGRGTQIPFIEGVEPYEIE